MKLSHKKVCRICGQTFYCTGRGLYPFNCASFSPEESFCICLDCMIRDVNPLQTKGELDSFEHCWNIKRNSKKRKVLYTMHNVEVRRWDLI